MSDFGQNISSVLKPANVQEVSRDLPQGQKRGHPQGGRSYSSERENVTKPEGEVQGTVLSVRSLIRFLEDNIEARLDEEHHVHAEHEQQASLAPWMRNIAANANYAIGKSSSEAVNAYTRTSLCNAYQPRVSNVSKAEPLRIIYGLVTDLRILDEAGILHLSIASGDGFLKGIRVSVDDALMRIHHGM